jgi:hypothetical protein
MGMMDKAKDHYVTTKEKHLKEMQAMTDIVE